MEALRNFDREMYLLATHWPNQTLLDCLNFETLFIFRESLPFWIPVSVFERIVQSKEIAIYFSFPNQMCLLPVPLGGCIPLRTGNAHIRPGHNNPTS